MGTAQSLSSLLAIGMGVVVKTILARPNPFPANHMLLLGIALFLFSCDPLIMGLLREPRGAAQGVGQLPWRECLPRTRCSLPSRWAWLFSAWRSPGAGQASWRVSVPPR